MTKKIDNANKDKVLEIVNSAIDENKSCLIITSEATIMNGRVSEMCSFITFALRELHEDGDVNEETIHKIAELATLDSNGLKQEALKLAKEFLKTFMSDENE